MNLNFAQKFTGIFYIEVVVANLRRCGLMMAARNFNGRNGMKIRKQDEIFISIENPDCTSLSVAFIGVCNNNSVVELSFYDSTKQPHSNSALLTPTNIDRLIIMLELARA